MRYYEGLWACAISGLHGIEHGVHILGQAVGIGGVKEAGNARVLDVGFGLHGLVPVCFAG
jgi:hypothetical protein